MPLENKNHVQILVVDDEQGMCDLLRMELTSAGYSVTAVSNSLDALERIKKQKFDLVISDLKMPQMDGIELLGQIKKYDSTIEVIITTGYGTIESATLAMKQGAYDFVLKPYPLEELCLLIEKCVEKRQLKTLLALYESSKAIFSTIKLEELFRIVTDLLPTVLQADGGSLMLLNSKGMLEIVSSRGVPEDVQPTVSIKIGERVVGRVAETREAVLLINGLEKYPLFHGIESNPRIKSSVVCPLINQGALLGVLSLNRTQTSENFTTADMHSASIFASQIAMAIQNARLYESLRVAYERLEVAQDQLLQSEKLVSIGRLVAGVAHELNNPLTSVVGYTELMLSSEMDSKERQESLRIVFEQAQRCGKIVKDLLLFARKRKLDLRPVNPCRVVDESVSGLSLEMERRKVKVTCQYPLQPVAILADDDLLKQVITNILTNAGQALENLPGDRKISITVSTSQDKVYILCADNGPGIAKENILKVFDPFFSTKGVGKGTGLGLSLSYGIIRDHGGAISVKSAPGEGAAFAIEMPLQKNEGHEINGATESEMLALKPEPVSTMKIKKILLVEDETPIRQLIMTILAHENFEFEAAENGRVALQKISANDYDLILCDYQLPELNGLELFREVKKVKPESAKRFLFVSGSTQFMQNYEAFFKENQLSYLLKPFTKKELLEKMRAITGRIQSAGNPPV